MQAHYLRANMRSKNILLIAVGPILKKSLKKQPTFRTESWSFQFSRSFDEATFRQKVKVHTYHL